MPQTPPKRRLQHLQCVLPLTVCITTNNGKATWIVDI